MAKLIDQLTDHSRVGFIEKWRTLNEIRDALTPLAHRYSGTTSALNGAPVIVMADATTPSLSGSTAAPSHWRPYGSLSLETYWCANNVTASQVVTIEARVRGWASGGLGNNDLIAATHQDITIPTTAYELFTVTFETTDISDIADYDQIHWRIQRLGTDAADTYAADIYYVGGKLTYTPS